jgi:hypothetical protein
LSRVGFELFYHLFGKYNTEIVVMSEVGSEKLDSDLYVISSTAGSHGSNNLSANVSTANTLNIYNVLIG